MFQRLHKAWRAIGATALAVTILPGCAQEMANQPRVDTLEPSHFAFANDIANRVPVTGTVSRSKNLDQSPKFTGIENGVAVERIPVDVTPELLARGQQRYNIFCQHCHGQSGAADGMVVKRGFPAPPSYGLERLKNATDGQLFLTIKNGVSRMPAFGNRIDAEDRWAIVAYIRALQLSQDAPSNTLSDADRDALNKN